MEDCAALNGMQIVIAFRPIKKKRIAIKAIISLALTIILL